MSGSTRLNVGVGWLHEIDKATCMDDLRLANCERPRGDRQSRVPKKDPRERRTARKENSFQVFEQINDAQKQAVRFSLLLGTDVRRDHLKAFSRVGTWLIERSREMKQMKAL